MRILLAIDGSPGSESAVAEVCRRPWPPQTEVRVLTVLAPLEPTLLRTSAAVFEELVAQQRAELLKCLDQVVATLRDSVPELSGIPVLREGSPKEVILEEAERFRADLIVLGSQGRGALSRFFLGSVSQAIVANAPCSVEIVRVPRYDTN